jgi:putative transcriptional regulator
MEKIDVVRLRGEQTQAEFAAMLGISVRTLQDWEQGRRSPNGPAVALLRAVQSGTFRKPKR